MTTISITEARSKLHKLVDNMALDSTPILITGKRTNAVLVSEDDWRAIQETLHLVSIPGMRESILRGLDEPIKSCSEDPGW